MEDGCEASLIDAWVPNSTRIIPLSATLVGGIDIQDLRQMKKIVIPEGTERIGNHWFWYNDIESVEIPASVREIGADAFYGCKSFK